MDFFAPSDSRVDGSVFTPDDLTSASEAWGNLRSRYAPDWSPDGDSVLARLFRTDANPAVRQLIALAWTLHVAQTVTTTNSSTAYGAKVRNLFMEADEVQFDEQVTEFQAVELLGAMVSPIAFEPYVDAEATGDRPAGPDFAVRLPEGDVAVEVTVFHVDQLDAWTTAVRQLVDGLRERIGQLGAMVAVELEMPLEFNRAAAQVLMQRKTLAPVLSEPTGELRVAVGGPADAILRWQPLAVVVGENLDLRNIPGDQFAGIQVSTPDAVGSGFAVSYRPSGDAGAWEEMVMKSLANTLRGKRRQSRLIAEPLVLAIKSGHHRVMPEMVMDLFERRVWSNPLYSWITAVGIISPRLTYNTGDAAARLVTSLNRGAAVSAGSSLTALLAGEKGFHLLEGRWYGSWDELTAAKQGSQTGSKES